MSSENQTRYGTSHPSLAKQEQAGVDSTLADLQASVASMKENIARLEVLCAKAVVWWWLTHGLCECQKSADSFQMSVTLPALRAKLVSREAKLKEYIARTKLDSGTQAAAATVVG